MHDGHVAEAYFAGGRVALTVPLADGDVPLSNTNVAIRVRGRDANATVELLEAVTWSMQGMWVSPEDVLAAPRPDAGSRTPGKDDRKQHRS